MGALDGKVAIVTGAGRGVGRGHALAMAAEGAKIVVNDLGGEWDGTGQDTRPAQQVADEIKAAGGDAVANYDSVADWQGGQNLVNQALETFGDLDILVNNAGILRDRTVFNMSEEEWDAVINVHLKGHFVPTHFATAYWQRGMFATRIGWPSVTPCVRLTDGVLLKRRAKRFGLYLTPNEPKAFEEHPMRRGKRDDPAVLHLPTEALDRFCLPLPARFESGLHPGHRGIRTIHPGTLHLEEFQRPDRECRAADLGILLGMLPRVLQ